MVKVRGDLSECITCNQVLKTPSFTTTTLKHLLAMMIDTRFETFMMESHEIDTVKTTFKTQIQTYKILILDTNIIKEHIFGSNTL